MKQVKISDVKKVINGNTNEIVTLAMYGLEAQYESAKTKGYDTLCEKYNREWSKLFDLLEEVGYYDDCKIG